MRTTIDAAGRLVIPKALRRQLGLVGGTVIEIVERGGALEIRPADRAVTVDDTGDRPVLRAVGAVAKVPPLSVGDVRTLVEQSRG